MSETAYLSREERVMLALRALYRRSGYSSFKMSRFEEYELYLRNKEFLIGDSVITFTDANGRLLALKPDVTLSIVKNFRPSGGTAKYCYNERVYRYSREKHSFSEILQSGIECLGDIDTVCTAEVLILAIQSLQAISDHYVLELSHMGVIGGILTDAGLSDDLRLPILRAVGERNMHELSHLTEEAALSVETAMLLRRVASLRGTPASVLPVLATMDMPATAMDAVRELETVCRILRECGMNNVILDYSLVGDMRYYGGIIFRGFIAGIPERVLSGGRYDCLLARMNKAGGAIGFAVYLDTLERTDSDEAGEDEDIFYLYEPTADPVAIIRFLREKRQFAHGAVSAGVCVPTDFRPRRIIRIVTQEGTVREAND